jgi:N-acetylmuramic acid 6-phosphate etherase
MIFTEADAEHRNLHEKSIAAIIEAINIEDNKVANAVKIALPQIEKLITAIVTSVKNGGRLFYIGAGTSGRLGVLDASECMPTFGIGHNLIIPIIAGGEKALTQAIEGAEDDEQQGWKDLQKFDINSKDIVIGLSASGTTPYVLAALNCCKHHQITTAIITCNNNTPIASIANYVVEVIVGPEIIAGSTRMKSGTAQKMVLNMISTTLMIQLGRVEDNKMIFMQPVNKKLQQRSIHILLNKYSYLTREEAEELLNKYGTVSSVSAYLEKNYR